MQDFRMETFLEVCKYMNYTRAAKSLNLTQPAVSQHIRFLEKEYQVSLFRQTGKRIALTPAGEILRDAASIMQHDEQHMKQKMLQTQLGIQHYHFGATRTVAEFILLEDLKAFLWNHPECCIQMQVHNTQELLEKLDSAELDFAIVEGDFPKKEYKGFLYRKEEFVAAASPAISQKYQGATIRELLSETLLLRENGSGSRVIFEQWLNDWGLDISAFSNQIEIGNIGAINALAKEGFGITFCYRAAIAKEIEEKELEVISLRDMHLTHDIMFIFRKDTIFYEDYLQIYQKLCTTQKKETK